jgi:sterol desaturase/sphingolipid hydroxylase (fatty acid hydroxylase superfamily)
VKAGAWQNSSHRLDRMSLKDLVRAFVAHPSVMAYAAIALAAGVIAALTIEAPLGAAAAIVLAALVYPFAWYVLHRFVLHGKLLYKHPMTAALWKRIHYDHHQDPRDLRVLFGALYTTLPTIGIIVTPIGYLLGGVGGAASAFTAGILMTIIYEFFHCVQHLNTAPKNAFLKRIKRLHLSHHYHDETSNFGIIDFGWDRAFGTYRETLRGRPRSATVFNLGYDEATAARYPWVARLTARSAPGRQTSPEL